MTEILPQSPTNPVAGGYIQPATGVTVAAVVPYRDTAATSQAYAAVAAPAAGAVVASTTPGVAGLYEVSGYVTVTGTTVATADSNNMAVYVGATKEITIPMIITGTTGSTVTWPIPTVVVSLAAADVLAVKAVAAATGSSSYQACLVARLVG